MAQSPSVEPTNPELEALEAFLGSSPDELVAFTETPFGALLAKVNELGFDGGVIQAELASTGILDAEAWTSAVGVDLADFLALNPVEYAERYPEQGAPLVAAILNSIHLSEEQASLHSVAGGTNLSKGEKIGIGVGAAVTGLYLAPKIFNHLKLRSLAIEMSAQNPDYAEKFEKGWDMGNGVVKLETDFMGIKHMDFRARSVTDRLNLEWKNSLFPTVYREGQAAYRAVRTKINPNWRPQEDRLRVIEDDLESRGSQEIEESIGASVKEDLPGILRNNNDIDRNVRRASVEPSREANYLSEDLKGAAKAGIRPKSMEVNMDNKLVNMAEGDLEEVALADIKAEMVNPEEFDEDFRLLRPLNLFDNEEDAISQEVDEFESSVEQNLNEAVQVAKQDLASAVERQVSNDVSIAEDAAQTEVSKLEEAVVTDAKAVEVAAEEKVEGAIADVESV